MHEYLREHQEHHECIDKKGFTHRYCWSNSLPLKYYPKNKVAILDCSSKAEASGLEKSKNANDGALATLSKNGMKVLPPSTELANSMANIGDTMTTEWVAKAGDSGKKVIADFKK